MKKIIFIAVVAAGSILASNSYAQLIDEKNVTITMDLQPILQLNMTTPDQIDFVFDEIPEYIGGITKYAGTVLKVSSSVSWDLYAAASSNAHLGGVGDIWDQQVIYGAGTSAGARSDLPLNLLEMHQFGPNNFPGTATNFADYSGAFRPVSGLGTNDGQNNVYVSAAGTPYVSPPDGEKYINGGEAAIATALVPGGSYLTTLFPVGTSDYYFVIDYRVLPGLPAIFPLASDNTGAVNDLVTSGAVGDYAQPGVYTMDVKYVLIENQ
jgi:hypothetical protein